MCSVTADPASHVTADASTYVDGLDDSSPVSLHKRTVLCQHRWRLVRLLPQPGPPGLPRRWTGWCRDPRGRTQGGLQVTALRSSPSPRLTQTWPPPRIQPAACRQEGFPARPCSRSCRPTEGGQQEHHLSKALLPPGTPHHHHRCRLQCHLQPSGRSVEYRSEGLLQLCLCRSWPDHTDTSSPSLFIHGASTNHQNHLKKETM